MNIKLNEKEACEATYDYLEGLYKETRSDDLAILLSDMGTLLDGDYGDPAFWTD